jgi:PKD repeat protein
MGMMMIREHWITGAFLVLLIFAALTAHASAWYSSDWDYGKEFTINNTGSELTNYQVMFTVNRSAGSDSGTTVYLNSKCEEDYDDIRFVGADDTTAYNYWIESSSSTVASIWVNFTSLPTGNTTIYLYYGNSGASAVSDGYATFPVFDDFLGSAVDTDVWTVTGSPTVSGGILTVPSAGICSKTGFGTNYCYRSRANLPNNANCNTGFGCGGTYWALIQGNYPTGSTMNSRSCLDGSNEETTNLGATTGYNIFEIKRNAATSIYFSINDVLKATHTSMIPSISLYPSSSSNSGVTSYVDWILVRKYTATEPTISAWGSEEARSTVAAFSANVTTGNAPLHVGFTDASTGVGLSNWTWDFQNDDTPDSYDQNPAFTYTIAGVYTVNLTVTGTGGTDSEIKVDYITVTNATPTPTPTPTGTPPVQEEIPEGHLTPLAFVVLAFMVCGLTVYTFADNQNRNYLYIATAAVAMIVSFLLGIFLQVGTVSVDFVNTLDEVTVNESVLSTYDVQRVAITDLGFGWFFIFWGVVMLIITILAVIELFREPQRRYEE